MATTKMTRKGQVTIPIEIREHLNLSEGVVLSVREVDGKVVLENPGVAFRRSMEKIWEFARTQPPQPPVTAEEIDDIVADAIIEKYLGSLEDR